MIISYIKIIIKSKQIKKYFIINNKCIPLQEEFWCICADQEDGVVDKDNLFIKKWDGVNLREQYNVNTQYQL